MIMEKMFRNCSAPNFPSSKYSSLVYFQLPYIILGEEVKNSLFGCKFQDIIIIESQPQKMATSDF